QLGVELAHPVSPKGWAWANTVRVGRGWRTVPSDECFVWGGKLFLAKRMEEQLEPEEWRPILASSLILKWRLEADVKLRILLLLLLPVLIVFALSQALLVMSLLNSSSSSTRPSPEQQWIFGFNLAAILALVLIPSILYGSYYQEAKLIADTHAA